ncbi:MAG: S8 family serine peptidase [Tepidisphaera sp.]|nr:S8 family serine peptidase [Tepidisphaera sp.]
MRVGRLAIGVVLACAGLALGADNAAGVVHPAQGVLNLRTGDVDTSRLANLMDGDAAFVTGVRYVIVLDGPLDPGRDAALTGAGVIRRGYLPLNAFAADLDRTTPKALRGLGFVRWVGTYDNAWRVDPAVLAGANGIAWRTPARQQLAAAGKSAVNVWLFEGLNEQSTLLAMTALPGCTVTSVTHAGATACISATMNAADAAALSANPDVQYVEHQGEYAERSNALVRAIVQSGSTTSSPLFTRGLHGEGQIVGLIDGYLNKDHCSFADTQPIGPLHRKILAYNTTFGADLHGTHVGGTLAGDAGDTTDTRGVAYAAKMVYNFYPDQNEPSVFGRFDLHASQGARMHNDSWGDDSLTAYDGACHAIDSFTHDQDDNLVVFAVTDLSGLVKNPENAKNSLAVTASGGLNPQGSPSQDYWYAGGSAPTADGRRKPEIAAPGRNTSSSYAFSTCSVVPQSGTSMAAPAVTGVGALIRQYFTSGFYPSGLPNLGDAFTPSGQLLKAMLVNSAVDMTGEPGFPSPREGWGRVLADNATYFDGDLRRLVVHDVRNSAFDALSTGSDTSLQVDVAPGQAFKATLAWADAPGAVNATFAPVNNLDLIVTSPTGLVYYGNNFAAGQSTSGGSPDTLNNLEQVLVTSPVGGRWTIDIVGTAVNVGPQGYALVVTGGVTEVVCHSDYNGDGVSDQGDVDALIQDIAAGTQSYPPNSPDLNQDGVADQGDVDYLINAIAGGGCP